MSELKLGASTFCLFDRGMRPAVDALLGMGFAAIELFGDAPQAHYTQLNPGDRRFLRSLSPLCELSLHAPVFDINMASANPCSHAEAVRQYREAAYLAAEIGAVRMVVHEGHMSYWKLDRQAALRTVREGLGEVAALARQVGVTLTLENTNFGKFAMYDTWQEWAALAAALGPEGGDGLGLTLDVGHATLAGWDLCEVVTRLAPRIVQMHIHDTSGSADDHLAPGAGKVDWSGLKGAILASGCPATLILENGPVDRTEELANAGKWLENWIAGSAGK